MLELHTDNGATGSAYVTSAGDSQLSSQWQAAITSSAANDCRELAARSYTLREAGSCHSTFD